MFRIHIEAEDVAESNDRCVGGHPFLALMSRLGLKLIKSAYHPHGRMTGSVNSLNRLGHAISFDYRAELAVFFPDSGQKIIANTHLRLYPQTDGHAQLI